MNIKKNRAWDLNVGKKTIENLKKQINYEKLKNKKNIKILDFGCGNGRYLDIFKELFPNATLYGVDINKEDIRELKKKYQNVNYLDKKKAELNFSDNYFDLIFSSNVIEHIPKKLYLIYIKEFHRTLKKNCRIVYGTPNYPYKRFYDMIKAIIRLIKFDLKNFKYYLFDDPTHINKLNYEILEKDFKIFKKNKLYPTNIIFPKIIKNKKYSDKIVGIATK